MNDATWQSRPSGPVMSREQVRAFDAWAIEEMGIPGVVLMENAGRGCADIVRRQLDRIGGRRPAIFCGVGNNGGDGFVIARHLFNLGADPVAILCGPAEKLSGDAAVNHAILQRMHLPVLPLDLHSPEMAAQAAQYARTADLIVDAIFGTGLQGPLRPPYPGLIDTLNAQGRPIIAVDIPSGLDCDTGRPLGAAIRAQLTVTFAAVKKGFVVPASQDYTGQIHVASIGINPARV